MVHNSVMSQVGNIKHGDMWYMMVLFPTEPNPKLCKEPAKFQIKSSEFAPISVMHSHPFSTMAKKPS